MRLSWLTFELENVKKKQHRVTSQGDMWTRVLMRLMADFARETFEINMGLLAALEGQGSASKGMWGHKSYVMKFLADFVLDTFENHRFAAVHRGKGELQSGCGDTSPMS